MLRRPRTQLLGGEFDGRDDALLIALSAVANELNELQSKQREMQVVILVQDLILPSAVILKKCC